MGYHLHSCTTMAMNQEERLSYKDYQLPLLPSHFISSMRNLLRIQSFNMHLIIANFPSLFLVLVLLFHGIQYVSCSSTKCEADWLFPYLLEDCVQHLYNSPNWPWAQWKQPIMAACMWPKPVIWGSGAPSLPHANILATFMDNAPD